MSRGHDLADDGMMYVLNGLYESPGFDEMKPYGKELDEVQRLAMRVGTMLLKRKAAGRIHGIKKSGK